MKAKSLLILAGLPIMALISGPVAADAKTFPGALCQPFSGSFFIGTATTAVTVSNGGQYNDSSSGQYWICPIVRDTTAANTNGVLSAFVMAVDEDPSSGGNIFSTDNVSCTLNSMTKTGTTYDSASDSTSGSNSAAQQLDFANIDASADGYYYLSCKIPEKQAGDKRSGILMYQVNEE